MATQLTIHVATFLEQFRGALHTQLADLRNALRSLEDGSYAERVPFAETGSLVSFVIEPPSSGPAAAARQCSRCFLSLMTAFTTFLDHLVTIKNCSARPLRASRDLSGDEEILRFAQSWFDEVYAEVSTSHLTVPAKLDELPKLPAGFRNSLLQLAAIRNCIEHHGGIARKKLVLPYCKAEVFHGEVGVTSFPRAVNKGDLLRINLTKCERAIEIGSAISLTESELEGVVTYLSQLAGPNMVNALAQAMKTGHR